MKKGDFLRKCKQHIRFILYSKATIVIYQTYNIILFGNKKPHFFRNDFTKCLICFEETISQNVPQVPFRFVMSWTWQYSPRGYYYFRSKHVNFKDNCSYT